MRSVSEEEYESLRKQIKAQCEEMMAEHMSTSAKMIAEHMSAMDRLWAKAGLQNTPSEVSPPALPAQMNADQLKEYEFVVLDPDASAEGRDASTRQNYGEGFQTSQADPLSRSHFIATAFPQPSMLASQDGDGDNSPDSATKRKAKRQALMKETGTMGLESFLRQGTIEDRLEGLEEAHPLFKKIFGPLVHLFLHLRAKSLEVVNSLWYLKYFEILCVTVILVNCGLLWHMTDEEMDGVTKTGDYSPEDWTSVMEVGFLIWYCVEILIKLYFQRAYFFFSDDAWWNITDCVLVLFSVSEIISSRTQGINVSYLRGMRILRVVKLFRMFRVLRMIQEIKLLVDCVVGSVNSLLWSFVLLCLLLSFFSIFCVAAVSNALRDDSGVHLDAIVRADLIASFSTVQEGMLTLFMCVSGGRDWSETYYQLRATSRFNGYVFLAMVITFYIAVWNVVSSIFVERAMRIATPSLQQQLADKKVRDEADARDFYRICKRLDVDESGTLSCEEFSKFARNPEFKSYFEVSGLDIKNAENFFQSLTKVTGVQEMELNQFVSVCMRLRGMASSVDVHLVMVEMRIIYAMLADMKDELRLTGGKRTHRGEEDVGNVSMV